MSVLWTLWNVLRYAVFLVLVVTIVGATQQWLRRKHRVQSLAIGALFSPSDYANSADEEVDEKYSEKGNEEEFEEFITLQEAEEVMNGPDDDDSVSGSDSEGVYGGFAGGEHTAETVGVNTGEKRYEDARPEGRRRLRTGKGTERGPATARAQTQTQASNGSIEETLYTRTIALPQYRFHHDDDNDDDDDNSLDSRKTVFDALVLLCTRRYQGWPAKDTIKDLIRQEMELNSLHEFQSDILLRLLEARTDLPQQADENPAMSTRVYEMLERTRKLDLCTETGLDTLPELSESAVAKQVDEDSGDESEHRATWQCGDEGAQAAQDWRSASMDSLEQLVVGSDEPDSASDDMDEIEWLEFEERDRLDALEVVAGEDELTWDSVAYAHVKQYLIQHLNVELKDRSTKQRGRQLMGDERTNDRQGQEGSPDHAELQQQGMKEKTHLEDDHSDGSTFQEYSNGDRSTSIESSSSSFAQDMVDLDTEFGLD